MGDSSTNLVRSPTVDGVGKQHVGWIAAGGLIGAFLASACCVVPLLLVARRNRRLDRRKIIGWAMEAHLQASLAIAALTMAIGARQPHPHSLIHHSGRGVQYACGDYTAVLKAHAIQASMSRPANPYDNAKAESFMKTLKQEEVDGRSYRDFAHARDEIGGFIEAVYNTTRLHSALGYKPPAEFDAEAKIPNPLIRPTQAVSSPPNPCP